MLFPEEQEEYNNAKFPATHKMAMILDLSDPTQMPEWMSFCLTTFQAMGVTSEKVRNKDKVQYSKLQDLHTMKLPILLPNKYKSFAKGLALQLFSLANYIVEQSYSRPEFAWKSLGKPKFASDFFGCFGKA
ncbi:hypothetical protein FB446DRAFT_709258 [Lentinula raphanica]|nr:hypothetical protein FB446DRAFT_709258 [Lentinula raphanica]